MPRWAAPGRLAASLDYGFTTAFTAAERARLAVLHLFRDTADVDVLRVMGDPDAAGEDAVPELAGLDREAGIALLDRAADIGLLTHSAAGTTRSTPPCPGTSPPCSPPAYGQPATQPPRAARAYATAIGDTRRLLLQPSSIGARAQVLAVLRAEEANLLHALDLARATGLWDAAARLPAGPARPV